MQLYAFEVSGIASETQSDAGKLRPFYWCHAYSEAQALKWASDRRGEHLHSLRITSKELSNR